LSTEIEAMSSGFTELMSPSAPSMSTSALPPCPSLFSFCPPLTRALKLLFTPRMVT